MTDEIAVGNFVKLYGSIVTSSVWSESAPTRIVWLTMLAIADVNGAVAASVPGLARLANVTVPECEAAIKVLSDPDPYSKTPDHDGRRIKAIPGGWLVLNYKLYRELRTPKQVHEAERKAEWRERQKEGLNGRDNAGQSRLSHTEVEVEAEVEGEVTTKSPLSPAREESKKQERNDTTLPAIVTEWCKRQDRPGAWLASLVAMLKGVGAPGGKAVTPEHLAEACLAIDRLPGDISPRRFGRVLEQVTEPKYKAAGGEDAEFVKAATRLQEIASYRDPVRSQSLSADGWKIVTPQERAALKAIGTVERVLTAKPDQWPFVVRDFLKAQRGAVA